ncbi:MAG: hypothetical protein JJU45_11615 [Acidimicrobiia bacterium]|nr:hypothetical protein [Acidimicrobiia bacterium]
MRRHVTTFAVAALMALLAMSCGSSGPSFDEWADLAADLCLEQEDLVDDLGEPQDPEEAIDFLIDLLDLAEVHLEELQDFGLPSENRADAERMLELWAEQIDLGDRLIAAFDDGNDQRVERTWAQIEDLADQFEELAVDLGIPECVTSDRDDEPSTTTTPQAAGPFTFGDDPELDALWEGCDLGDMADCDELWRVTPVDSEYEAFGATCGGRLDVAQPGGCTEQFADLPFDEAMTFGDNIYLDLLWAACEVGDVQGCNALYVVSALGSDYETFGFTCGERVDEGDMEGCLELLGPSNIVAAQTFGDDEFLDALWLDCDAGDGVACELMYRISGEGSDYESLGATCGNRVPDTRPADCSSI